MEPIKKDKLTEMMTIFFPLSQDLKIPVLLAELISRAIILKCIALARDPFSKNSVGSTLFLWAFTF